MEEVLEEVHSLKEHQEEVHIRLERQGEVHSQKVAHQGEVRNRKEHLEAVRSWKVAHHNNWMAGQVAAQSSEEEVRVVVRILVEVEHMRP